MHSHSTLARLAQGMTLWVAVCALAWLLWRWPVSPMWAMTGSVAILSAHAWVLAVEFLLHPAICRGDVTPPARAVDLLRAWWHETRHGFAVFAWRQPWRWRAEPDQMTGEAVSGRHGIIFIHGFVCNRGFWTPWLRQVKATGRACLAVNLEPVFTGIDGYVPLIDDAVERMRKGTGLPPVLVCHSMGGLAARAWLRTRNRADAAAHVVTIGSPHAGTWLARFSHLPNGRQMRQDAPWIETLANQWSVAQGARFTCWYSNCDNIVMPPSSATLPGADNRLVRGAAHVDLAFRPEVMRETLALVDRLG